MYTERHIVRQRLMRADERLVFWMNDQTVTDKKYK
jgi:hypothetical protein